MCWTSWKKCLSVKSYVLINYWKLKLNLPFFFSLSTAPERAHWVTSQAARLSPRPPWEEKEEGEPWGSRTLTQGQKVDRPEGQAVPQAETRREDPDEEDVSTNTHNDTRSKSTIKTNKFQLVHLQHQDARTEEDQAEERRQDAGGSGACVPAGQRGTVPR